MNRKYETIIISYEDPIQNFLAFMRMYTFLRHTLYCSLNTIINSNWSKVLSGDEQNNPE